MARFGDFTLLEELGSSAVADRYKASHATLGGPFFLKVYRRLHAGHLAELQARGDLLIGVQHKHLAPHLGHGVTDGIAFAVSPWIDGLDLHELSTSLRDRRVNITLDHCVLLVGELASAVAALHAVGGSSRLAHGDVSIGHVRVSPDGSIKLTGLTTPRGLEPGRVPEGRFDLAGTGALIYDLVPLLHGGAARPPLPTALDRVIRRALGIGPVSEHLGPIEFAERLGDVFQTLKLNPDKSGFVEIVQRTIRAIDKKNAEKAAKNAAKLSPADAIPELVPVSRHVAEVPELLPLDAPSSPTPASAAVWPPPPMASTPAPWSPKPPPGDASFLTGAAAKRTPTPPPLRPITPAPPVSTPPPPRPMTPAPWTPPVVEAAPAPKPAPRPATMPMMPVVVPAIPAMPPPLSQSPSPSLGPAPKPALARPSLLADPGTGPEVPAYAAPAPAPVVNPALDERTDPDAQKPARIEAQKALPAVQALVKAGLVSAEHVERAAIEQAQRGGRTVEILVAHGHTSDDAVADALAKATGKRRLKDAHLVVKDQALLKRLPQTYALARRLLPLALDTGNLILAVADPYDDKVIREVKDLIHALDVEVHVAARAALTTATLKAFADLHGATVAQSGPRVLLGIKDDNKAQKLGARLAQEGMKVEHVVDGTTARTIIQTRPPDAVIVEHNLPGVDGQALLLSARNNEKTAELPVFIVGPRSDDDLMAKVLDLGADDYFGEPVRPDVVVAKLRRATGKGFNRSQPPSLPVVEPAPAPAQLSPLPKKAPPVAAPAAEFAFDDLPDLPPEFDAVPPSDAVPAMPTGVMGTLRQMALPEIVQSLEMGRKTASVDVVPQDGEKGAIAFEQGAIKYAEYGSLIGEEAFYALMRHKEGFFRIHYGDAPKSVNIEAPTTFLLLEAMRLMDEEGA